MRQEQRRALALRWALRDQKEGQLTDSQTIEQARIHDLELIANPRAFELRDEPGVKN